MGMGMFKRKGVGVSVGEKTECRRNFLPRPFFLSRQATKRRASPDQPIRIFVVLAESALCTCKYSECQHWKEEPL